MEVPMPKRLLQVVLVCLVAVTMLGAGTPSTSFDKIGHKLVCTCSCGQILLECNHVGCPVSGPMIDELHAQVATGLPETGVLNWFISKYGPVVLAEPIRGGFDNVAWIVPFATLLLATVGVGLLIRMWRRRYARLQPTVTLQVPDTTTDSMRDRIRRDTDYGS
jgi:cytochrome c-type biogenesis protein CcmH/NrfF